MSAQRLSYMYICSMPKISVYFQIYNSFVNPLHDIHMHKTVLV